MINLLMITTMIKGCIVTMEIYTIMEVVLRYYYCEEIFLFDYLTVNDILF